MTVEIELKGFVEARRAINRIPADVDLASMRSVNDSASFAQSESSRLIRDQVNLSASYIGNANDPGARLRVAKRAKPGDNEAIVAGRKRPTSLAQFMQGTFKRGNPVKLKVAPGRVTRIPNAFPIKLRRGTGSYDPSSANAGIALRLKPGESVRNKREMVKIAGNLYLLYGPSVDQVFRDVSADVAPAVSLYMEDRFTHHYSRISRGE